MNTVTSPFDTLTQDVSLAPREMAGRPLISGATALSDDIIHELRQPLGVIDSLAYYLELTTVDDKIAAHLERIRAMVSQANVILERASDINPHAHSLSPSFLSGS